MIKTVFASCTVFIGFAAAAVAQNNTQLCMQPPEVGVWQNEFAETHQVSRLEIAFHCDGNGPYGRWEVRALMKCAPRDCTWGRTGAQRDEKGRLVSRFRTYNADRFLLFEARNGRLELFNLNVPRDPGKRRNSARYTLFPEG